MAKVAVYHMVDVNNSEQRCAGVLAHLDLNNAIGRVLTAALNGRYAYTTRLKTDSDLPCEALAQTFRDTQNEDGRPWVDNESVIYLHGRTKRSTTMGDIFVMLDKGEPAAFIVTDVNGYIKLGEKASGVVAKAIIDHSLQG